MNYRARQVGGSQLEAPKGDLVRLLMTGVWFSNFILDTIYIIQILYIITCRTFFTLFLYLPYYRSSS